jgi:hypothetical protein
MLNVLSSAVLWSLWKLCNDLCFQVNQWKDVRMLAGRCARMLGDWRILQKSEGAAVLERWMVQLERRAGQPEELTWETPLSQTSFLVSDNLSASPGLRDEVLGVSVGNSDVIALSVSSVGVSMDYGGLSAGLSANLELNSLPSVSK